MFKFIISLALTSSILFANIGLENLSVNSIMNQQNSAKEDKKEEEKTYASLINSLKSSSSGEYTMYLAVIYLNGISEPDSQGETVPQNIDLAIKYFEKSISLEYYQASAILGSLYIFDPRFMVKEDNVAKAKHYLNLALEKEVYESTMALANIYFYYEKDIAKALEYLHLGASKNIATAELALATLYGYGSKELGIEKNEFIGNQFLEKACKNKNKTDKVEEFCNSDKVLNYKKEEVK